MAVVNRRIMQWAGALLLSMAGQAVAGILPPAGGPSGLTSATGSERFPSAVLGPVQTCSGVDRQMAFFSRELVAGEPLTARLILTPKPTPQKPARFAAQLSFSGDIRFLIQPPGRVPPYRFVGTNSGIAMPTSSMEMEENMATRMDFRLALDRDTVSGGAFDIPGKYRIRVSMACVGDEEVNGDLELGIFDLTVKDATGEDAAALKLLDGDLLAFTAIQERTARSARGETLVGPTQLKSFETIHATLRKAALRPHAMIVLADYHVKNNAPAKAEAMLREVIEQYAGTPYAQEAQLALYRAASFSGNLAAQRDAIIGFWADPDMTYLVSSKAPSYEEFIKPYIPTNIGGQWMLFVEPGPDPTAAGVDEGMRIALSPEVQQQLGLPEFVTPSQLGKVGIPIN